LTIQVKDNKDVLTYDSYAEPFHVTNLGFYKEIIKLESDNIKSKEVIEAIYYQFQIVQRNIISFCWF